MSKIGGAVSGEVIATAAKEMIVALIQGSNRPAAVDAEAGKKIGDAFAAAFKAIVTAEY